MTQVEWNEKMSNVTASIRDVTSGVVYKSISVYRIDRTSTPTKHPLAIGDLVSLGVGARTHYGEVVCFSKGNNDEVDQVHYYRFPKDYYRDITQPVSQQWSVQSHPLIQLNRLTPDEVFNPHFDHLFRSSAYFGSTCFPPPSLFDSFNVVMRKSSKRSKNCWFKNWILTFWWTLRIELAG
jgi:hypothetical protein